MTTSAEHLAAMRREIIARLAAGKLPADIVFWTTMFDQITFQAGNCAVNLANQETVTAAALTTKTAAEASLVAAQVTLFTTTVARNNKQDAVAALQAAIDALPNSSTTPIRQERDAVLKVRAHYGV